MEQLVKPPRPADAVSAPPEAPEKPSYPPQIRYIVGNEAAERFSYYGMRSVLVVFMVGQLLMEKSQATAVFHYFVSACYLSPLLGAWISDRFLGKYKTIIYLSLGYCVGHGILAAFESKAGLYAGLFFIALGAGGIKPCVSAFVGDQFTSKNKSLVKGVFDIFYWVINFGSFFSTMLIPWVLPRYGSGWAFGIPGILMAVALWIFWLGRHLYHHVPPTRDTGAPGFMPVFLYAIRHRKERKDGEGFFKPALAVYKPEDIEGAEAAAAIFKVFATVSVFWALFDQHGSSWVLQAQQMNLHWLGMDFKASQLAALNPLMVMLLIPVFGSGIYPAVEKLGIAVTPLRRMSAGMILAATSFVGAALIQLPLDQGVKLSVGWQVIPYLLITCSEIMISITGLEFAYTQAPRSMKSTIMSFWFLTVFAGNMLTAFIAELNIFQGATFFFFFAGLMAAVSGIFVWSAMRYKPREYFEEVPAA
ncbi:MAG: POT family MFS transporter [Elusimicrobia bacterium]|nr:POT family MFS transporter [Elusimicrobiota bacterium]